jgi:D-alanyl-D-alanine carboxypeptidase-like protein
MSRDEAAAARTATRSCGAAALVALALAGCGGSGDAPPAARAQVTPTATPSPPPVEQPVSAIVWGLERPARAARRLRRHPSVAAATPVGRGAVLLRDGARAGYAIPLDTLTVDPEGYAATLPAEQRKPFGKLRPGRAILSTTSAALRDVGAGGSLRLTTGRVRVVGVVADESLRNAEIALASRDRRVKPVRSTVMVLLREPVSPRELIRRTEREAAARIVDGAGPVGPARPAQLKVLFGEPAVALPYGNDWVRLDPAFVRRYIVTRRVPILGAVTCHRKMIPPLRAALGELARRGLSRLVNPGDYAGCYAPRRIQPRGQLSLHAWGVAIDLNASANPFMGRSRQDRRLVRTMVRHGFTWGGDWPTRPDPMHFELRTLPPP